MARLNEAPAPAIASNTRVPNVDEQPTIESLEAGEPRHNSAYTSIMRTKSRREPQDHVADDNAVKRSLMRQNRNLARSHSAQKLQILTLNAQISDLMESNTALRADNIGLKRSLKDVGNRAVDAGMNTLTNVLNHHMNVIADLAREFTDVKGRTVESQVSPESRKSMCLESMQFRDRPSLRELMNETQMPTIQEIPVLAEDGEEFPRLSDASGESMDLGPPPVSRVDEEYQYLQLKAYMEQSINIESRPKRKNSLGIARRRSTLMSPLPDLEKTPKSLTVGAKRKISERDREDVAPSQDDVFKYSKKSSLEGKKCENKATEAQIKAQPITKKPARRVLGEKSTNFSPKKARVVEEKDNKTVPKANKDASKRGIRQSRGSIIPMPQDVEHMPVPPALPVLETELYPETPAAAEVLSPASSEPASRGIDKADTPPPGDISLSSSTTSMEGTRPSRRARASVNYAEPSLVAKMRRPGKEMLDALSGLQDPRHAMGTSRRASQDVMVKSLFKNEISTDSRAQNTRSPMIRKPDEAVAEAELSPIDTQPSLSLAALMAETKGLVVPEDLDIFEFTESSPPRSPEHVVGRGRRHSVTTKPLAKAAVRRRSMMV